MPEKVSKNTLYAIMVGMLVFGSANTIVLKYQDNTHSLG